jgi:O-6-methylguanine DNA methyltransferase
MKQIQISRIQTEDGVFQAGFSSKGLAVLAFPGDLLDCSRPLIAGAPSAWVEDAKQAILAVLKGAQPARIPRLDLEDATPFQREVWKVLRTITPGEVMTYAQVARAIGRPRASRAVGAACGANPIPLLIPCHRVVASNGSLGGFSVGLRWKEMLLRRERGPHIFSDFTKIRAIPRLADYPLA